MIFPLTLLHRFRKLVLAVYVLLWVIAFAMTHVPGNDLPDVKVADNVLHTFGFMGLASALIITLAAFNVRVGRRIIAALLVMPIYGAIDEYTQQFFHRTTDFRDWCHDVIGTLLAIAVCEALLLLLFKRARRVAAASGNDSSLEGR